MECRTPPRAPTSAGYIRSFLARHPGISKKAAHPLELQRMVACKRDNIRSYFDKMEELMEEHAYDPALIFNFDETMIENKPHCIRVLVPTSSKRPSFSYDEQTLHMTLCLCIAADGTSLKPLVILPNKEFPPDLEVFSDAFCWSGAESGWMNRTILKEYMSKILIPCVTSKRAVLQSERNDHEVEMHALLVVDGHSSRECPDMLDELSQFSIDVMCIPSHTSHILQPLDCGVNRAFKAYMKNSNLRRHCPNGSGISVRRPAIISMVKEAAYKSLYEGTIRDSFAAAGLNPFDPARVLDGDRITPEKMTVPVKQAKKRTHLSISNCVMTRLEFREELRSSQEVTQDSVDTNDMQTGRATIPVDFIEEVDNSTENSSRSIDFDEATGVEDVSIDEEGALPENVRSDLKWQLRPRKKLRLTQMGSK